MAALYLLVILFFSSTAIFYQTHKAEGFIPDRRYYEKHGDIIWEVPNKKKIVALTFDDGPDPRYTPKILDILKENHVKATFFLIGYRMQKYPDIVRREVEEGHELGNHSYTHQNLANLPKAKFLNEINQTEDLIHSYQIPHVKLLRPPLGLLSKNSINMARKENFEIVLWSWHQDPRDWANPGVYQIFHHVRSHLHNGDIILLHDAGGNRLQTVQALKKILPTLKKQGYEFTTVSQLLRTDTKYKALFYDDLDDLIADWGSSEKNGRH